MSSQTVSVQASDLEKMPAAIQNQAAETNYVKPSTDDDVMTGSSEIPDTQRAGGKMVAAYVTAPGTATSTDTVNIPDKAVLNDYDNQQQNGRAATLAHETTHVLEDNMAPSVQAKIPEPKDGTDPYDISDVDDLRKSGKTFQDLPREKAATVVQKYIESGGKAANLKPWIQDIKNLPLSTIKPTTQGGAADKINTQARAPRGGQAMLTELSENDVHNPPPAKSKTNTSGSKTISNSAPKSKVINSPVAKQPKWAYNSGSRMGGK